MQIEGLDHVVLTAHDVQVTANFYARVLGMRVDIHEDPTHTFHYAEMYFGSQKINVHQAGHEFEPKALHPAPGTADLCFVTTARPEEVVRHLQACGVAILEGPVPRTGARGQMASIYLRDPDQNLLEIAHYTRRARRVSSADSLP
jgi:catechol 2,3-dioxygenase-like lactoylglutathione lyase family enzyme